jgi:hypothetical protein
MNRVQDYAGFAVRLFGIGYAVLWPFTGMPQDGAPLGAAHVCAPPMLRLLCGLPHPLILPAVFHVVGCAAAAWVAVWLSLWVLKRGRRARSARECVARALNARIPSLTLRSPRRKPAGRLRTVKPRSHFGLRGRRP